ncbi:MAG: tetratricopeptide repeat protein [Proteobacteria bacterium]|nr:tetratricopeptide repeat protein [Pseudomonadota bacterium]
MRHQSLGVAVTVLVLAAGAAVAAERNAARPYVYEHRAVSTPVAAAQAAFDRGLTLVYAYQPEEAEQAFRQAARLDPDCAMAFWGVALALGANINVAPTAPHTATAARAIRHARRLAAGRGTAVERDFIEALAARYSTDESPDFDALALAYRDRMRTLVSRYPHDADAAALLAEAIMDVRPWRLWTADGEPAPGTAELVTVIEAGLREHPRHLGLLHYYIHAVEASRDPGRALDGARRLAALPMEPAAAHLIHMPAHTFLRVGDWQAAVAANEHAVHHAIGFRRSKDPEVEGACSHCLHFLSYAYAMQGNFAGAKLAAGRAAQLDGDANETIATLARFGEWQALLDLPAPAAPSAAEGADPHLAMVYWHYGRGLAELGSGRPALAQQELEQLRRERAALPPPPVFGDKPDVEHVVDKLEASEQATQAVLAERLLTARIALAAGQGEEGLRLLREAVELQDRAEYSEPPPWNTPLRETLARALFRSGQLAQAEAVLRDCLGRVPHDPRALAGLVEVLRASDRGAEAAALEPEAAAAAARADRPLRWDPF